MQFQELVPDLFIYLFIHIYIDSFQNQALI